MKLDKNTLHNYWIENEEKFKSIVDSMTFYSVCGILMLSYSYQYVIC